MSDDTTIEPPEVITVENDLVPETQDVTTVPAVDIWADPEKVRLVKDMICGDVEDDEFEVFAEVCRATGLNPFMRQIKPLKIWDKKLGRNVMQLHVTIDGARLIAQRSAEYEGQTSVMWCGPDGQWVDVWLSDVPPAAARVGVYRTGFREACFAVARFDEYAATRSGKLVSMWAKMPALMIAKCAEMLALRKAFPAEMSGLYSEDEMAQAQNTPASPARQQAVAPVAHAPTADDHTAFREAFTAAKGLELVTDADVQAMVAEARPDGVGSTKDAGFTRAVCQQVTEALSGMIRADLQAKADDAPESPEATEPTETEAEPVTVPEETSDEPPVDDPQLVEGYEAQMEADDPQVTG